MAARRGTALILALVAGLLTGAPAPAQEAQVSIVGGDQAEAGEYPWQVAVLEEVEPGLYSVCGGTLIDDSRVLTAAHCTTGGADSIEVLIGTQLLSSGGIGVSSYADHPSYSPSTYRFDAAVLELAGSGIAAGGAPLQLIGEQGSADDALWAAGDELAISGWGATAEDGELQDQLREARVPRVADSTCGQSDYYGSAFQAASMLCAGLAAGGVDSCQGDSGGPLAASTESSPPDSENDPSKWRLAGITSWGEGCARPKRPGVYTRVAVPAIRNWILDHDALKTLIVSVAGSGTVTSDIGGIDCLPDCSFGYGSADVVTLTPRPVDGSTFLGWGGEGCTGTGTCTVTMDQARSVTANFVPTTYSLTVARQGGGSGTVKSDSAGIDCGSDCSETYAPGSVVVLTATPASGSTFAGWDGGDCSGTGTCTVTMSQAREVSAIFGVVTATPATGTETADQTPPVAAIASNRLRMNRRGFVRLRIDCGDSPEDCLGVVRLRLRLPAGGSAAALRTVARASFEVVAGEDERVRVRLNRRARRLVRRRGRVRIRLVAVIEDAAGNARALRERRTLRAAK